MKKILKSGRKKETIEMIQMIIDTLAIPEDLAIKHRVHSLSGNYNNYMECHILPDLLLLYAHNHQQQILELIRIGSHSDLFK
ncbi:MAG: type II toxin-antitoxin system YafQ family toxin [Spirochaetaceae bacterium]|nr:type II toxin-antitoxin system YafQ family toxin [Spirochaetaceae bacterium]